MTDQPAPRVDPLGLKMTSAAAVLLAVLFASGALLGWWLGHTIRSTVLGAAVVMLVADAGYVILAFRAVLRDLEVEQPR